MITRVRAPQKGIPGRLATFWLDSDLRIIPYARYPSISNFDHFILLSSLCINSIFNQNLEAFSPSLSLSISGFDHDRDSCNSNHSTVMKFFFNLPSSHRHHQNPNRDNSFAAASTSSTTSDREATNPSYSSELRESASGRTEEEVTSYESANDGEVEEEDGEEISPFRCESPEMVTASASQRNADCEDSSVVRENKDAGTMRMDSPPGDDCCPICFSNFVVPCRGPCGHWYCGGCILQYWNYSAALQPCNCPMCSKQITKLTPEASLHHSREVEVTEVLRNIRKYNRLFVGGTFGFVLKVIGLPLYIKRVFNEMMNPDRPGAHLNKLRIGAMFLGLLYTISPFDFLRIGRQNVIDVFDYSAIALSIFLYLAGLYLRRRRFQNVREMAAIDP